MDDALWSQSPASRQSAARARSRGARSDAACRALALVVAAGGVVLAGATTPAAPLPLTAVRSWAYQIQNLDAPAAVADLAATRYDLLVIDPVRTSWSSDGTKAWDTAAMVARLQGSMASDGFHRKLVLGYLDIGEAENWRWYWTWSPSTWSTGARPSTWPSYIVEADPQGWAGDYPVAFWEPAWQDLVIDGKATPTTTDRSYVSMIDELLQDGFDGVYLDWVDGCFDQSVASRATAAGKDAPSEMIAFIANLRAAARLRNPNFLVIQQNASQLCDNPAIFAAVDGIGQEDTWYGGTAGIAWDDPRGYDNTPQSAADQTAILTNLRAYRAAGKAVFTIDYAVAHAPEVYASALANGFVPYCSRSALSALSTTPPPALGGDGHQMPTVTITSPATESSVVPNAVMQIAATAAGRSSGIARVEFYADSDLIDVATMAPYTITWTAPATARSLSLRAVAIDASGAATTSAARVITVDSGTSTGGSPTSGSTTGGSTTGGSATGGSTDVSTTRSMASGHHRCGIGASASVVASGVLLLARALVSRRTSVSPPLG